MAERQTHIYTFGPFRLDTEERLLLLDGEKVSLADKAFETLVMLVENAGHLLGKDDLMGRLWPDTFVEEANLAKHISLLRKVLSEATNGQEFIETVPKRGYRFVAPVNKVGEAENGSQSPSSAQASLTGKKVSHYRVLELVGGGGMGMVYKAEDIKLGRRVALKFLAEELAADSTALQRFQQEARSASALSHPNICTIYAIEEHDGHPFLALELLEGQTLRELLSCAVARESPLPPDRLLDIGVQVADGLDAAHRQGIIHRDIKPANIFVTNQGQAKILDFGLAKLQGADASEAPPNSNRRSSTKWNSSLTLTRTGTTIGTAGYMSPEQARGEQLDARSDLFSLGLVLYEMATGQRAFTGETASVLREAILTQTPVPVRELNPALPPALERIIHRTLEKDRSARYQSSLEIRADLQSLRSDISPAVNAIRTRRRLLVAAGILVATVLASSLTFRSPALPRGLPDLKQVQLTSNSSENAVTGSAISPDGKLLAFADLKGIHVKEIETGETRDLSHPDSLRGSQVDWSFVPTWTPDGTAFVANAAPHGQRPSVWLFSIGGTRAKLRDDALAWSLSRDGSWLAFGTNLGKTNYHEMWVMKPDGTQAHKLFQADEHSDFGGAEWSPNGKRLAYVKYSYDEASLAISPSIESRDLTGGRPVPATAVEMNLTDWAWSPDGRIFCSLQEPDQNSSSNLWATRIDSKTGKPLDSMSRLTRWSGFWMDQPSVTANAKRLTFRRAAIQSAVFTTAIPSTGARISSPVRLTLNEGRNYPGAWTADGKAVVLASDRNGKWEIFKHFLDRDAAETVATPPGYGFDMSGQGLLDSALPRLSPDGAWILYLVSPPGQLSPAPAQLMRTSTNGGQPELVFTLTQGMFHSLRCSKLPADLCVILERSADHRQLVFTAFDAVKGRGRELARYDTEPTLDAEYAWDLSPDGKSIALLQRSQQTIHFLYLDDRASYEIVAKRRSSLQGLDWGADGKTLFVSSLTDEGSTLSQVDLRGNFNVLWESKGVVQPSNTPFLSGPAVPWAVASPDGRHLAICLWSMTANIWMTENF